MHLQTLLAASQYAPDVKSLQDVDVPHLQAPDTQVSPDTLHASTVDEHLQTPFPLFAVASHNSPVDIPAHDARFVVHLQMPLPPFAVASQNAPVVSPAHEARAEVHLHTLLAASQYAPEVKPAQDEAEPHLHAPETQVSPGTLQALPYKEHVHSPFPPLADASTYD